MDVTDRGPLAILAGLADVERDLIRTRTAEGRNRAKERGQQHMDRPSALTSQQRAEGAALKEVARSYDVGLAAIVRLGV